MHFRTHRLTALALLLCLPPLLGADGCPLDGEPSKVAQTDPLELGGDQGSLWNVQYANTLGVRLLIDTQSAFANSDLRRPVLLLGQSIDVGDFCWRNDTICPQQLLPAQTQLAQPQRGLALMVPTRRGPLALVTAVRGVLDGKELGFAFDGGPDTSACVLQKGSVLLATLSAETASPSSTDGGVSDGGSASLDTGTKDGSFRGAGRLDGKITLVYRGDCFTLGGSAVLTSDARVELSARFVATRSQ